MIKLDCCHLIHFDCSGGVDELQQHVAVLESTVVGRDNTVTKLEDQLKVQVALYL